jgi:uncharacterized membrane protein YfcA
MFFHVQRPESFGAAPGGSRKKPKHEVSPLRLTVAAGLVLVFVVASFIAQATNWTEGARDFIHLAEILVGAFGGAYVGEKGALDRTEKDE